MNDCLMILVRFILFFASCSIVGLGSNLSDIVSLSMDSKERNEFLASVEAEEDWLDQVSRRLSLPSTPSVPETPPCPTPPPAATSKSRIPASAGPTTRSSRKRRISQNSPDALDMSDGGPAPGKKSSRDDKAILDRLESMITGVRSDIAKSEANTAARIDSKLDDLSVKLTGRLSSAESTLATLGSDVARMQNDILTMKKKSDVQARSLSTVVEDIVARKLVANPAPPRPTTSTATSFEQKYWEARRSLRIWPISGPNLVDSLLDFFHGRLKLQPGRIRREEVSISPVTSAGPASVRDQVVVVFDTIRARDEVKSAARNLGGSDRSVGLQLEAPDHLRSHYQCLQKLGYQIKQKHPGLKRNVKFDDVEMSLVMDIKTSESADWKTISHVEAKSLLKKAKKVPRASNSKAELDSLVNLASPSTNSAIPLSDSDDDYSDAVVIPDENKDSNCSPRFLSFLNANARSLAPKIESLSDCLTEKGANIAFLTETWFQDSRDQYQALRDYSDRFSLGIINRNRSICARNLRQYGGVAIVYRYATTKLDEFILDNPNEYEVVAAVGKINGIKGKVFCISCYAPPNITRARAESLLEFISDVISEGKRRFQNCTIIVCGDFNQWPAEYLLEDHPDLSEVAHGPTRNGRSIDRSFVNFGRSIIEAGTLEPLESEDGSKSDHRIAWAKAKFLVERPSTHTYTYRAYSESGAAVFLAELDTQTWHEVFTASTTSQKVEAFQAILDNLMSKCFKYKTVTRCSRDPPWFNSRIKHKILKRRKVYDRQGRSARWKKMKAETDEICRKMCASYLDQQKNNLTAPDAARAFYRNVKAYSSKEKPPIFDVKELYPEKNDAYIAESLADHFNSISNEFEGLNENEVPPQAYNSLKMLTAEEVVERLKSFKKPKSTVKGDIFPALVNRAAPALAAPLQHIYNNITLTQSWPTIWKTEYVTPIPKKTMPQGPGDLRNISCTQLFSKVYESFILQWLGQQVRLRLNQYGGVKGCGTEHFLVNLWQRVLENIEDPGQAVC